jgi:hypothetical protein
LIAQKGTLAIVHAKRNDPSGKRGRVGENTGRAMIVPLARNDRAHASLGDAINEGPSARTRVKSRSFRLRETIAQVARWAG